MKRKRRYLLVSGACLGLGAFVWFCFHLASGAPVTQEQFKRLAAGMTVVEVEEVMGFPGAKKHTLPREIWVNNQTESDFRWFAWKQGKAEIKVGFDDRGTL